MASDPKSTTPPPLPPLIHLASGLPAPLPPFTPPITPPPISPPTNLPPPITSPSETRTHPTLALSPPPPTATLSPPTTPSPSRSPPRIPSQISPPSPGIPHISSKSPPTIPSSKSPQSTTTKSPPSPHTKTPPVLSRCPPQTFPPTTTTTATTTTTGPTQMQGPPPLKISGPKPIPPLSREPASKELPIGLRRCPSLPTSPSTKLEHRRQITTSSSSALPQKKDGSNSQIQLNVNRGKTPTTKKGSVLGQESGLSLESESGLSFGSRSESTPSPSSSKRQPEMGPIPSSASGNFFVKGEMPSTSARRATSSCEEQRGRAQSDHWIENDPFSEFRFKKPSNDRNDPKIEELFFTPPPVSPTLSQSLPGSTSSEQLISSMDASSDLSFERRIARVLYDFAGVCEDQTFFAVRDGDEVAVITTSHNKLCGWYRCENETGQIFFLPSNYLVSKNLDDSSEPLQVQTSSPMPVTPKGTKKSRFRKSQRLTNTLFKDFRDDDMKKLKAGGGSSINEKEKEKGGVRDVTGSLGNTFSRNTHIFKSKKKDRPSGD